MTEARPKHYQKLQERYPQVIEAAETLGRATQAAGPLSEKEIQLVQLGASVVLRSEGAVKSHARRALDAGANAEEIRHAVIVLTGTVGFSTVAASLDWLHKILD